MGFEEIRSLAREAASKHGDDIDKALDVAEAAIKKHPDYRTYVRKLVRESIREMIHDCRHRTNQSIRAGIGAYGRPPKVNYGNSKTASVVHQTCYDYCINGTLLVLMTGDDLRSTAVSERLISDGHIFNAVLCEELAKIVPADKTVKQSPAFKKLSSIFERVKNKVELTKVG